MRRGRGAMAALLLLCAVAGVVVAAVRADGRAHARSDSNDGGAWLLNLADSEIGHVNRVAAEVSSTVVVDADVFEVDQAPGVVLVHDVSNAGVSLLDGRTGVLSAPVGVPESARVTAVPGGVVVFDPDGGEVWRQTTDSLLSLASVEDAPVVVDVGRGASVAVGLDGMIVVHDPADGSVWWSSPGLAPRPTPTATDLTDQAVLSTLVGERLVLVDAENAVWVVDGETATRFEPGVEWVVLQQPSPVGTELFGIDRDGRLVELSLLTGEVVSESQLSGSQPLRPIVHRGEVWSVMLAPSPAVFYRSELVEPLEGVDPLSLRLRLVNGWVWANDASDGDGFLLVDEDTVISVRDWPSFVDEPDDSSDVENDEVTVTEDAEVLGESIERELDEGENLPPDARDDVVTTRVDVPVTVNVLGNDSDRNGDALSVVAVTEPAVDAVVSIVGVGDAVSVVPPAGAVGDVVFEYTVSDGRPGGTATATVTVTVVSADGNQPPEPADDTLRVGVGARRSVNVTANDTDPDGDPITLIGVDTAAAPAGAVVTFAPDGVVVVAIPEGAPEDPFELPYTVIDDRGEDAAGLLTVTVVSSAVNDEPQLLPDRLVVFAGQEGRLNVLANDTDAENTRLVAGGLEALEGAPSATLDPDGSFVFPGSPAGAYRYRYTASDGTNEPFSFVRVDVVEPPEENQPPVPGLDEVTLPVGLSRVVRVLDNDVDPDGDVVGIVYWEPVEGLSVDPVPGVGFRMSATAAPPATILFPYWISDGRNEPVQGMVVVSVTGATVGLPPVAVDDQVELRAGQTSAVRVLDNDYDPDGEVLRIVEPVPSAPGAVTRLGEGGQWLSVSVDAEASGDLELRYEIVDADGNDSSAVLRVRVIAAGTPNRPPVLTPDVARTLAGEPVAIDPLANDRDPDGDQLVLDDVVVATDSGATVEIVDGLVRYTPAPGFTGTDTLTYSVTDLVPAEAGGDGAAITVEGTIAVGVVRYGLSEEEEVNIRPTAVDDGPALPQVLIGGGPVELDLLENDFDGDGDRLTILPLTSQPTVGSVELVRGGRAVTYTPPATGEARQVTFRYSVTDGLDQDDATVTVTLVAVRVPQPPIARDDTVVLRPGETAVVDVLGNDEHPDGDSGALEIEPSPDGAYQVVAGGIEITAGDSSEQIPYTIIDPDELTAQAVVTVQVAENRRPVAPSFDAEVIYETATTIDLAAEGAGDPDLPDDTLIPTVEAASGGDAEIAGDLSVRFTPAAGSTEPGSFRYTLTDAAGESATGTVTVTITGGPPTNEPPVATSRSVRLEAGTSFPVELDLLVDDPDTDVGDLVFGSGGSAQGNVEVAVAGSTMTITAPLSGSASADSITWTVSDGTATDTATIDVTVTPAVFDPPTARDYTGVDARAIDRGDTVTVAAAADAVDNLPESLRRGLRVTSVDGEVGGSAITDGSTITFTPVAGARSGSFSYTIEDAEGGTAVGRVEVIVRYAPGAPTGVGVGAPTETSVTVTWAPPGDDGGSPITGYTVALTGAATRTETLDASARSWTFEGLSDSSTFQMTVAATNAVSPGAPSSSVTAETLVPLQVPLAPVLSAREVAPGTVEVSWNARNALEDIDFYELRIGQESWRRVDGLSLTRRGIEPGTAVVISVRGVNRAGRGADSVATIVTEPLPPEDTLIWIAQPNVDLTNGTVIRVNFETSLPTTWVIRWSPSHGGGSAFVETPRRSHGATIFGLEFSTSYSYTVTASREGHPDLIFSGSFRTTTPVEVYEFTWVDQPSIVSVDDNSVTISWTTSQPASGGLSLAGSPPVVRNDELLPGHTLTLGGLEPGETYRVAVRAERADGLPMTEIVDVTTTGAPIPEFVWLTLPRASVTDTVADLGWRVNLPYSYTVEWDGGSSSVPLSQSGGITIRNLTPGATYVFTVRAVSRDGQRLDASVEATMATTWPPD